MDTDSETVQATNDLNISHLLALCYNIECVRALGRCCTVSRPARELCDKVAVQRTEYLLLGLICNTAALGPPDSAEVKWRLQAVAWLLQKKAAADACAHGVSPSEAKQRYVESLSNAIIRTPAIHRRIAGALDVAGMSLSYDQLAAAAREQVLGLEVWLQINLRNGNRSNLPLEGLTHFARWGCELPRWLQ